MGSYTQPSRVLDKSHSVLNDAVGKIQTDIATSLKNNRARAIEEQKRLEKQRIEKQKADVKRQKDINTRKERQRKMSSGKISEHVWEYRNRHGRKRTVGYGIISAVDVFIGNFKRPR